VAAGAWVIARGGGETTVATEEVWGKEEEGLGIYNPDLRYRVKNITQYLKATLQSLISTKIVFMPCSKI
jgi:hypothetical protein